MNIRHATEADLPAMMKIYEYARAFMAEHGNPNQWGARNWPPESLIRQDIAAGKSYVCTHGDNHVMQSLLKKCGFTHCGTIYVVEDDDPRLAYEKM